MRRLPLVLALSALLPLVALAQAQPAAKETKYRSAKDIIDAFAAAEKAVNEDFGKTIPTVSQSLTVFRNNFMIWVGEMDQALGITQNLSKFILYLSENLNTLIPILTGVGVAIAAAFAPSLITAFAAQIRGLWVLMAANPIGAVEIDI